MAKRQFRILVFFFSLLICGYSCSNSSDNEYAFKGKISENVLNHYLARAVTMAELCSPPDYMQDAAVSCLEDDIRLIDNIGAKFIGRAIFRWGQEKALNDPEFLNYAQNVLHRVHKNDPDVIFQAGIFEVVTPDVESILIPSYVFEAFNLPIQIRPFNFGAMVFTDGLYVNHFDLASVPDINRIETKLWMYYLATSYIDAGFEAIHWGQIGLTGIRDDGWENWFDVIGKVREYAKDNARRSFILNDAHTSTGYMKDERHLLDFNSFPLRIQESEKDSLEGVLKVNYPIAEKWQQSIYQKSKGGIAPSGWTCESLPYLVEFDNFGISDKPGQRTDTTDPFIWGYDEITWFSLKNIDNQKEWLEYAYKWIAKNTTNGHLQMPVSRVLVDGTSKAGKYKANYPNEDCPNGTGLEGKIKELWSNK